MADYTLILHCGIALLAIVSLAPIGLYMVGKIKDPFHPLIFIGTREKNAIFPQDRRIVAWK